MQQPRRVFLRRSAIWATGITAGPALLAACGDDDDPVATASSTTTSPPATDAPTTTATAPEAEVLIGDVVDFALESDEWEGDFGFVTMRIHAGVVDGESVYYVRTDTSDADYAEEHEIIHVPKLAALVGDGLAGRMYRIVDGAEDQATVLSTEPGRDDYSPAWHLHHVTVTGAARTFASEQEILDAVDAGGATVEATRVIVNAGIVRWSDGEMAVDTQRVAYLGEGQLLEPVDTEAMTAKFKLNMCYPSSRYFVLDHSFQGAANNTNTVWSPALDGGPSGVGATGRTNVFRNGLTGPGPMGAQPSAFDFDAGDVAWSPYWDHWLYEWAEGAEPRLLTTQAEIFAARDAGDLIEIPGVPATDGAIFTVNCPVPILAPVTYEP